MANRPDWGTTGIRVGGTLRLMPSPLDEYYEGIDRLSDHLALAGATVWAETLTAAKRGGSTFGEILSNTGVVLRGLAEDPALVVGADVKDEIGRLQRECQTLWDSANGVT